MRPVTVTNTSTGTADVVVTDIYTSEPNYTVQLTVSGTNTSTIYYSVDDPFASYASSYAVNATWWTLPSFSGATATTISSLSFPVRAFKLDTTAYTSGSAQMLVVQQGLQ